MRCPNCGSLLTSVINTWVKNRRTRIIRKRECKDCGTVFHTEELVIPDSKI